MTNKSDPTGRIPLLLLLGLGVGSLFPVFSGCSPQDPGAPFADVLVQDYGIATVFIRSDCTIALLFGYGHETMPHKFDFGNNKNVKGGFIGCYPGTTNKLIPTPNRLFKSPMDETIMTVRETSEYEKFLLEDARNEARELVRNGHCPNGVTIKTLWVGYEGGINFFKKPPDTTEVVRLR